MSRHGRPQAPAPSRAPALASSVPPSAVAPPPAPPPAEIPPPPPPPAAPAVEPPEAPTAAPPPPAIVDAPGDVSEPPAPATPRIVALVRIFAGYGVEYAPGEEIPATVATDGLTEGLHWRTV